MRITTSSWSTKLPPDVQKIGISRGTPRGYAAGFRKLMSLAPGSYFKTASIRDYRQLYFEGLRQLDVRETVKKIEELAGGRDCALLCYEAPKDDEAWCHRGYVSAWLFDELGLEVPEFGLENRGVGWSHPKIPAQYRKTAQAAPLDVSGYVGAEATDKSGRVWKVVGFDPTHPDQAMVESAGEKRAISGDVLKARFKPLL